jgi:hypothetical protein
MKTIHFAIAVLLLHVTHATATDLVPLSASTPQLAAVKEWHRAILADDYGAYERSTGKTSWFRTEEYKEIRKWTPEVIKVTLPKALSNGNFELNAVGCKNDRRQAVSIVLVKAGADWKVLSTGWAQVWGPDVKTCPV